jgi:cell division protein FtsW
VKNLSGTLIAIVILLALFGAVMVASITMFRAEGVFKDDFLIRQVIWLTLAIFGMLVVSRFDYHKLAGKWCWILLGLTVVLLALVIIPHVGAKVNGARRWFRFLGMSIQPSELAKLAVIIIVAFLVTRREGIARSFTKGFLPVLGVIGLLAGLIVVEPDLGTALVVGVVGMTIAFLAGMRLVHLVPLVVLSMPAVYYAVWKIDWRQERLLAFLDPWKYYQGAGYQLCQALISLGSGGSTGVGLGQSHQKLGFLPQAVHDFIFAIIGEELGVIGTLLVVALFVLFVWYGMKVARRAPDLLGFLIASGVTMTIGMQALINMAVVTGLVPTKGISLPFVSYGGSSVVLLMCSVGVLLNVARQAEAAAKPAQAPAQVGFGGSQPAGPDPAPPPVVGATGGRPAVAAPE